MNKEQIDIFYDMACLCSYVGELTPDEDDQLEQIQTLYGHEQFDAINVLFNEEEYELADDAFDDRFGYNIKKLNELADEYGFVRVGEA